MTALEPFDRELLDFLCACAHHRVRVVRVKAPRIASLRRLRFAGLVGFDDHLPSTSALQGWTERQQTKSEAVTARPADDEPPAPTVAAEGGGAARCDAPPPIDEDRLLSCFGDEFEQLSVIAARLGVLTPRIITVSRRLRTNGLVETDPPKRARPFAMWRRAQANTKANVSSRQREETPRSVGCDEGTSGGKKPIPVEAGPTLVEPAPIVAPSARARPAAPKVDIKVNEGPRPARVVPVKESQAYQRKAQLSLRTNRRKAEAFLDSGKTSADAGSASLRIEARKVEQDRVEQARFLDPIEQAKTAIRIGGWVCFSAVISGGPPDHYYIGTRVVPEAELLAFAERLRTDRARRAG